VSFQVRFGWSFQVRFWVEFSGEVLVGYLEPDSCNKNNCVFMTFLKMVNMYMVQIIIAIRL